jgi:hypothetical protein
LGLELIPFAAGMIQKLAVDEVLKCNEFTEDYGLTVTPEQAAELVETRAVSLSDNGRIEFGGGIIHILMKRFCDSPYISSYNYNQTLHELIEIFYYYKNETLDLVSDDELIQYMKSEFDGPCRGSLELLAGLSLDRMARNIRFGYAADHREDDEDDLQDEEYDID